MMTMTDDKTYVREHIRMVPDFPKKGIMFLDITTAIKDSKAMQIMVDYMYEKFKGQKVDYIAGIESRGFIFGAALAYKLGCGFITIRKPNKLPAKTIKEDYTLEYGTNTIEIHEDALSKGDRVVVIDDLLATGGTALAACRLINRIGAEVLSTAFVIELNPLKGREKIEAEGFKVVSMLDYDLD